MRHLGFVTLVLVLGTAALTACASGSGNLEDTLWRMTVYRNADGEMVETLPEVKTTTEFKDGQVGGKAACNTYNGPYEVDGDQISFGLMMSTMMACPPPIMDQEMGYLAALEMAATFDVKDEVRIHGRQSFLELSYLADVKLIFVANSKFFQKLKYNFMTNNLLFLVY